MAEHFLEFPKNFKYVFNYNAGKGAIFVNVTISSFGV